MGKAALIAGTEICLKNRSYTLLRKINDWHWQIEEAVTKRLREIPEADLLLAIEQGDLTFPTANLPASRPKQPIYDIPENDLDEAKTKRLYAQAVSGLPRTKQVIASAIDEVWKSYGQRGKKPSVNSVIRWSDALRQAGNDIRVLTPAHSKKGNQLSKISDEVREFIRQAIDTTYLCRERKTIQETFDQACILVARENRMRPISGQLPMPSLRSVRSEIARISAYEKDKARYGWEQARRAYRSVQGHRITDHPLNRVEIDHTPLDLFVVDAESGLPMGRPWITACIDDYTRCILGLCISFEPPSYLTVAKCLRHAFLPKQTLKDTYPSIKNDWIAYGVMQELVVDNGLEFHSQSLELACDSLGIELHYSARKTAWFKGKIERFLGTLNRAIAHGQPGTTFSDIFEKGDYDPVTQAVVSYQTLKEVAHKWIVDVYHQEIHRTTKERPHQRWLNNVEKAMVAVPASISDLDAILGRVERRVLSHKGIELDSLIYNSRELQDVRISLGQKLDVELRIDDMDLGKVIVLHPKTGRPLTVPALLADYSTGLTRFQHSANRRFVTLSANKGIDLDLLQAKDEIAQIIARDVAIGKMASRSRKSRYLADKPISSANTEAVVAPTKPVAPAAQEQLPPPPAKTERKKFKTELQERIPKPLQQGDSE